MNLSLRWVAENELDRVAEARLWSYALASKQWDEYIGKLQHDPRGQVGDYLLAERDGRPVGTATSLSMTMWMRGSPIRCQGVAWVGTVRTERRRGSGASGIATAIMRETLRKAKERRQAITALMPFRGSFYEHFGYGFVERRVEWTVPLALLPHDGTEGLRPYCPDDLPELRKCRQRQVERGQCDIERTDRMWDYLLNLWQDGFVVVDRIGDGPVRAWVQFTQFKDGEKDILRVGDAGWDDLGAFYRTLGFLGSLRDQYFAVQITLPADLPLNWLLKERQIPHRPVNHLYATPRPFNRMQIRILDHRSVLESLHLPSQPRGSVVVAVHESEGDVSRFRIDISDGRAAVTPSDQTPDVTCKDYVWAAILSGDLAARQALRLGLIDSSSTGCVELLEALGIGPLPFSNEYF